MSHNRGLWGSRAACFFCGERERGRGGEGKGLLLLAVKATIRRHLPPPTADPERPGGVFVLEGNSEEYIMLTP